MLVQLMSVPEAFSYTSLQGFPGILVWISGVVIRFGKVANHHTHRLQLAVCVSFFSSLLATLNYHLCNGTEFDGEVQSWFTVLWTSHSGLKSLGPTHNLSRLWHANPGIHHHWSYLLNWPPSSPPSPSLCYIKFFYKRICLNKNKKLTPCHLSPCSLAGHQDSSAEACGNWSKAGVDPRD